MKKVLLSFCLLIISLSAISQNISNDMKMLERHHANLRYSGVTEKLDEAALEQILNDEQFAIYEKATEVSLNFGATDNGVGLVLKS